MPILQYFRENFKFVPVTIRSDDLIVLREIAVELAEVIKQNNLKDSVTFIASSDMTHYEAQEEAERKDQEAIKAILELNEDKLMEKIIQP